MQTALMFCCEEKSTSASAAVTLTEISGLSSHDATLAGTLARWL